ncbi:MAG: type B chloramphenicol O-acetyltransferase, partial [Pseudomonadota bacterium]|nr:type B chloramphenicol O-acetyltransferase [Pseudomonadota bacterium]
YAIVVGNPATEIRRRFPPEQVQMLLEMQWWDWPLPAIEAAMPMLCSGDIQGLHDHWRSWP